MVGNISGLEGGGWQWRTLDLPLTVREVVDPGQSILLTNHDRGISEARALLTITRKPFLLTFKAMSSVAGRNGQLLIKVGLVTENLWKQKYAQMRNNQL